MTKFSDDRPKTKKLRYIIAAAVLLLSVVGVRLLTIVPALKFVILFIVGLCVFGVLS